MKSILLITTGGTIASSNSGQGLAPTSSSGEILNMINKIASEYEVSTMDLFSLDSSNIQMEEWQKMAETIYLEHKKYDGIVLTHGTDTMAYTGSILSFMLQNVPIPIVLTGSQLPLHHPMTDGIENLHAHLDILKNMTKNIVVCLNKYNNDTEEDINFVKEYCIKENVKFATSTAYLDGGSGAIPLAEEVLKFDSQETYTTLYNKEDELENKISRVIKDIYGASKINYTEEALSKIKDLKDNNLDKLPICIAKNQYSISDNKDLLGYPKDYEVTVRNIKLYNGAGFITIYLGSIITMPGLPKLPNYEKINLVDNEIIGLS